MGETGLMPHPGYASIPVGACDLPFSCCAVLCRAVRQHVGTTTAHYLLLLLLTSSGMFTASTALLPSSFAMYALTAAAAALIRRHLCKAEAWAVVGVPCQHCRAVHVPPRNCCQAAHQIHSLLELLLCGSAGASWELALCRLSCSLVLPAVPSSS